MAKQTHMNINGTWKKVKNVWSNVNGTWKQKVMPYRNVNGVWKECMSYGPEISWTASIHSNDLYQISQPTDGELAIITTSGDNTAKKVSMSTGSVASTWNNLDAPYSPISVAAGDIYTIIGTYSGSWYKVTTSSLADRLSYQRSDDDKVNKLAMTDNNSFVASGTDVVTYGQVDCKNISDLTRYDSNSYGEDVDAVAVGHGNETTYGGDDEGVIKKHIWGEPVIWTATHGTRHQEMVVSPNNSYLFSAGSEAYCIYTSTGNKRWGKSCGTLYSAACSSSAAYFGNSSGVIYKYDYAGNLEWAFQDPDNTAIRGMIYGTDGNLYYGTGDGNLKKLVNVN